jgi:hypothetical protein
MNKSVVFVRPYNPAYGSILQFMLCIKKYHMMVAKICDTV